MNQLNRIKLMVAVAKSNMAEAEAKARGDRDSFSRGPAPTEEVIDELQIEERRLPADADVEKVHA